MLKGTLPFKVTPIVSNKVVKYGFDYWYRNRVPKLFVCPTIVWMRYECIRKSLQTCTFAWCNMTCTVILDYTKAVGVRRGQSNRNTIGIKEFKNFKRHVSAYRIVFAILNLKISFSEQGAYHFLYIGFVVERLYLIQCQFLSVLFCSENRFSTVKYQSIHKPNLGISAFAFHTQFPRVKRLSTPIVDEAVAVENVQIFSYHLM